MARALRAELTESFQVVERDGRLAEHLVLGIDGAHAREVEERPRRAEAWPAESTKRSRFGQIGSEGSKRRKRCQSVYVTGAIPIGVPG